MKLLDLCLNGGNVLRYHTQANTARQQTVAEHSFRAFHIAMFVTGGAADQAVLYEIMYHDVPEYLTGDSPFPAKKGSGELKTALDDLEERIRREHGIPNGLSLDQKHLVKLCDVLEMGLYAVEQITAGNLGYVPIAKNVLGWCESESELMMKFPASFQIWERINAAYYRGSR